MLVRLIVDLEEAIDIETNQSITIADEKVLSMNNSPFATVATLTDYLSQLIQQSVVV
jgi:acyl carrier protein